VFDTLATVLLLLGVGFLVANVRVFVDFVRFRKLRSSAVLTWPGRKPPHYALMLAMGIVFGMLVFYKLVVRGWPPTQLFGESMMFVYYGYALPLSVRIGRGFYEDGIWAESGFIPYSQIGGLTWREGEEITLVLISRVRRLARRLVVPQAYYGAARRLLRDKIAAHAIHFADRTLDLGAHDERDDV
jgi:hypothetical protein